MLYLVATPIGNLGDITLRALETLREVDIIASEDTRKTGLLLKHFEIEKRQMSFYEHNEAYAAQKILTLLSEGQSVALVTNAGTPAISDPGFKLVREAAAAGYTVTAIPGASAHTMAVILSGLPTNAFTFRGFPPRKSGKRQKFIAIDAESPHTLIFYESPHRLGKFLADALTVLGDRPAAVTNDLTKKFETVLRGHLSELITHFEDNQPRGEYTVVIAGAAYSPDKDSEDDEGDA